MASKEYQFSNWRDTNQTKKDSKNQSRVIRVRERESEKTNICIHHYQYTCKERRQRGTHFKYNRKATVRTALLTPSSHRANILESIASSIMWRDIMARGSYCQAHQSFGVVTLPKSQFTRSWLREPFISGFHNFLATFVALSPDSNWITLG